MVCRELEELEEEEAHFGVELVAMAPFASDEADEEKVKPWRLERVPAALAKELQQYVDYRSSPVSVLFASPRARLDELTPCFASAVEPAEGRDLRRRDHRGSRQAHLPFVSGLPRRRA